MMVEFAVSIQPSLRMADDPGTKPLLAQGNQTGAKEHSDLNSFR
jgi:hypothetical protein